MFDRGPSRGQTFFPPEEELAGYCPVGHPSTTLRRCRLNENLLHNNDPGWESKAKAQQAGCPDSRALPSVFIRSLLAANLAAKGEETPVRRANGTFHGRSEESVSESCHLIHGYSYGRIASS